MKRQALASALSLKASEGKIMVLKELKMDKPKTKEIYGILKKLGAQESSLIITADAEPNVVLSSRNIPGVKVTTARQVSTYDAMSKRYLVVTEDALRKMEEVLA
jgi:large subunit ribosomal protein L4